MLVSRRSRRLKSVLALLCAVAFLFPEVGHAVAHHHAAEHGAFAAGLAAPGHHDDAPGHHDDAPALPSASDGHEHAGHPHLVVTAAPGAKQLLTATPAVVRVVSLHLLLVHVEGRLPAFDVTGLLPGIGSHGPPPPSRAPPLN